MANKDDEVQPRVRKKQDQPVEEPGTPGPNEIEEPTPTPPPAENPAETPPAQEPPGGVPQSPPVESPNDPVPVEEPETPEMPNLGRRVVDMSTQPKGGGGRPKKKDIKTTQVEQASLADFEAMLAESAGAPPRVTYDVGEKVGALVTSVGEKWIYFELPGNVDGMARRDDFVDKEGDLRLETGGRYDLYVLGKNEGSVLLGDQLSTRESAMEAIEVALETGAPLNGRVADKNKGGFEIDLGGVRAFCPISQIELAYTEDPSVHLGASYQFRVTEIREGGRSIVVSRAALLEEEAAKARETTLQTLQVGSELRGTVTRLADFGAFVDIGGIEGLVHVSEMGFSRVDHPSEVVREGEEVKVTVTNIDASDPRGLRVGLSMKDSMEDPWDTVQRKLHVGAQVDATITRLESFGAFAEVAPNIEGLIHVSELSWDHVKRPSDVVSTGQQVQVEVLDVDLARRRISLSMKSASGNPWDQATENFKPGTEVTGTVENVEDFGAFVSLGGGITALIPRSEMGLARESTPHAKFTQGDEVTARVLSIEPDRHRIALTMKSAAEVEDAADLGPRNYTDTSRGLGTLGDLLKDKLK